MKTIPFTTSYALYDSYLALTCKLPPKSEQICAVGVLIMVVKLKIES